MNKRSTLLIGALVVVLILGFYLLNKQPSAVSDGTAGAAQVSEEDTTVLYPKETTVTTKATAKPVTTTVATPSVPSAPVVTRVFENGQFVNIVNLTYNGFEPSAVSIARGESVRFVNRSGSAMRIVSTAEFSGLNQERSVGQGGIYELTFPVAGVWTFNNSGNKLFVGVVQVN